ncbi:MAG TPA: protein translocase subunit SecD [Gemmatimonadales bacterium]|nr:protein translocase subunit SecD [Gemmatimonadales bacterium]
MQKIRSRLIFTGILAALAIWQLMPTNTTIRVRDAETGRMKDSTVRRVPISLGLDLQGGIHIALEADQSKGPVPDPAEAIRRAERVVRTRIDEFGVTEPVVQVVGGNRLIVELAGEKDPARAKGIIQRTAFLEFRITDMKNLFRDAIPQMDAALRAAGVSATTGGAATPSAVSQLFGGDTSKAKAGPGKPGGKTKAKTPPGAKPDTSLLNQPGALSALLFQGSLPGEYLVPEEQVPVAESLLARPEVQRLMPRGLETRWGTEVESRGARPYRALYAVEEKPIITGEELEKASARRDQLTNQSVVDFVLSRRGGRIFERETARHVNDYMAIILDGRVQGQPPVIRSEIGQRGQIELGNKSLQDANDLALVLRAGALPVPLTIVEERTIGPSLGRDAIADGIKAGIAGVLLVIIIMISYYRVAGVLAVAALGLYALYTLGGLAGFGFTLTLPGLAGFVLSIGIAVDANVLIFERIREELAAGRTIRAAVDQGFARAMNAIVDSNVCAILTAFFLFQFGTGPVKGFAVTLILGVLASMITAIFVTRTFFMIWLQRRPNMQTLSI